MPGKHVPTGPPGEKDKARITIGYISADFRDHAAATLIAELFEHHNRDRFDVYGYSLGPDDGSEMRRRIETAFDRFVDLRSLKLEDAVQIIRDDGVDILVDLTGYTKHRRTEILAMRSAPVQVSYLGSGSTMGGDFMDYVMVDEFVVPRDYRRYYTEKVVYLPDCYLVNDRKQPISDTTLTRQEYGLGDEGVVYCCFSNNFKIVPQIFDVWMRILTRVPNSVIWLIKWTDTVVSNLTREAQSRGVDPDRLVFAPMITRADHMARYRMADLFLDTPLVTAGATAADSLLGGCPVLTCAGVGLQRRVAGSMVRAIALEELVTTSLDDYETIAIDLGLHPEKLKALREKLRRNLSTSALFNCERSTRHIEAAYETMWDTYCTGTTPRAFSVDPVD